jgi:hypothetical protein
MALHENSRNYDTKSALSNAFLMSVENIAKKLTLHKSDLPRLTLTVTW